MQWLCSRQLKEISVSICQLITKHHSNIIQPEPAAASHRTLMHSVILWVFSLLRSYWMSFLELVFASVWLYLGPVSSWYSFILHLYTHFPFAAVSSQKFQLLAFLCIRQRTYLWNLWMLLDNFSEPWIWQLLLTSWSSPYICEIIKLQCAFWNTLAITELSFKGQWVWWSKQLFTFPEPFHLCNHFPTWVPGKSRPMKL